MPPRRCERSAFHQIVAYLPLVERANRVKATAALFASRLWDERKTLEALN